MVTEYRGHLIVSPLRIVRPVAKNYILNLNVYTGTHYQTLNNMKIKYKNLVKDQIKDLPAFQKVRLTYVLYPQTKHLTDISNVCSVHDKFFCDALTEFGKLPEDNYLHLPEVNYRMGEVNKLNPRVEIYIEEIT